ncbi:hypothetical protein PHMEG_0004935 [Phytophthora megakarya]|uniref:Chromo domain-containing protein n=1 Tax=Phytophthora megakarya TaxID=4795 RepID=A0A225WSJ6_9STRA|nr:hypothetical protein PHMEG_0004935 [Phytophthora megakarya]
MHKKLKQAKARHNATNATGGFPTQSTFTWGTIIESRLKTNKLSVKWVGTYRVIEAKPNSFTVEHLINGSSRDVHAFRLKHYADRSVEITEEIVEHIVDQDVYLNVRDFIEHRLSDTHGYEVFVAWEGLEDIENSWEPISNLYEDVKMKLQLYADHSHDTDLAQAPTFKGYMSWPRIEYSISITDMEELDYLCGMWFIEESWLEYFMKEHPPSWETCDSVAR